MDDVQEAIKYLRGTISTFDRANDGLPYNPHARKTLLVIRAAEITVGLKKYMEQYVHA